MVAKRFLIFALLAGLFVSLNPAIAHHSPAEYDTNKTVSVKGTVTEFEWANPHAYIYMEVKNDKGETEKWTGELQALATLSRGGWTRNSVKPGDQITAYGNPASDGRLLLRLARVTLPNGHDLLSEHTTP